MPVGLRYFLCEDFPLLEVGKEIATDVQAAFSWGDMSATTQMTLLGAAGDPRFERYQVLHQVERDIDAFWNQQPVKRVLQNQRFDAFYNRNQKYFLLQCNQRDGRGVFDRLRHAEPPVTATEGAIDLHLVQGLGKTTGAYFGNLRIAKVNGAALFGDTTVVESEEWEHYAGLGELSVVYMRLIAEDGEVRTLQLMKDRSVVLHQDWGEQRNLDFVARLQETLDSL